MNPSQLEVVTTPQETEPEPNHCEVTNATLSENLNDRITNSCETAPATQDANHYDPEHSIYQNVRDNTGKTTPLYLIPEIIAGGQLADATPFNPEIQKYNNAYDNIGTPILLSSVRDIIAGVLLAGQTQAIRDAVLNGDFDKANQLKRELIAVAFSGLFSRRAKDGLIMKSALLVLDFDGVPDHSFESTQRKTTAAPFVVLSFVSPSGNGLKIVIRIDDAEYSKAFSAACRWAVDVLGIEPDQSGKDVSRLCFLCSDPDVYFNPNATVFPFGDYPDPTPKPRENATVRATIAAGDNASGERRFIGRCISLNTPPAIQGQNGSAALMRVARAGRRLKLTREKVRDIIIEYYNPRCVPAWTLRDIEHKLDDVYSTPSTAPDFEDRLLTAGQTDGDWELPPMPPRSTPAPEIIAAHSLSMTGAMDSWFDELDNPRADIRYHHSIAAIRIALREIALLGGSPGAGKTALAIQIVSDILFNHPEIVVYFQNCEMTARQLLTRILCRASGVDMESIKKPDAEQRTRLDAARETLRPITPRLFFSNLTRWNDIAADAIRQTEGASERLLVIDYVQRIDAGDRSSTRGNIDRLTDYLRGFAFNGWAILALSSVSRQRDAISNQSNYAELGLAAYKESGGLEYAADIAAVLNHRGNTDHRLTIVKDRDGISGETTPLLFNGSMMTFKDRRFTE